MTSSTIDLSQTMTDSVSSLEIAVPSSFCAVTLYAVGSSSDRCLPRITPLNGSIVRNEGSAGVTVKCL